MGGVVTAVIEAPQGPGGVRRSFLDFAELLLATDVLGLDTPARLADALLEHGPEGFERELEEVAGEASADMLEAWQTRVSAFAHGERDPGER